MPDYLYQAVPFDEASALIRGKAALPRAVWDDLLPELQASALVITGVEDLDVVRRVRDRLAELPQGEDWDTLKGRIAADLSPWLGDDEAALDRAELLLRSHGYAAYSAANWKSLEANKDLFPWRKYQTAQDGRVRASHAALNGLILPADSPFWVDHTPPWAFGCRCDVVGITDDEVQERLETDREKTLAERDIFEPGSPNLEALEQQGRIIRRMQPAPGAGVIEKVIDVTRDPQSFRFRPRDVSLLKNPDLLRERLGEDLFGVFREWAQATAVEGLGSLWDWVAGLNPKP
jgi:SPP1 gp7 family putative phage head morphogenesis protein